MGQVSTGPGRGGLKVGSVASQGRACGGGSRIQGRACGGGSRIQGRAGGGGSRIQGRVGRGVGEQAEGHEQHTKQAGLPYAECNLAWPALAPVPHTMSAYDSNSAAAPVRATVQMSTSLWNSSYRMTPKENTSAGEGERKRVGYQAEQLVQDAGEGERKSRVSGGTARTGCR